jgi:hypothetical protein
LSICEARVGAPHTGTQPPDAQPHDTQPLDTQPLDTQPPDTQPPDTQPLDTQPPRTPSMETFITAKALMLYEDARQPDIVAQLLATDLQQQCDRDGMSVDEVKACVAEHVSGLGRDERRIWLQRFLETLNKALTAKPAGA